MLTRQDVEQDYRTDAVSGLIVTPGRFEAEPLYVPVYWEAALSGFSDELRQRDGRDVYVFNLGDADYEQWPELLCDDAERNIQVLELWSDDAGFVYCDALSEATLRSHEAAEAAARRALAERLWPATLREADGGQI